MHSLFPEATAQPSMWTRLRSTTAVCCALATLGGTPSLLAGHIVPRNELKAAVAARAAAVQQDREALLTLFRQQPARKALDASGIEFRQVEQAVASLDAESAARLAARARTANQQLSAGALSNEMLTYIVIALATAVIVLIAVT